METLPMDSNGLAKRNGNGRVDLDAIPPQNINAERGVLGSILLDSATADFDGILALLPTPAPFYREAHQITYQGILDQAEAGGKESVDTITVAERLQKNGLLDDVGGSAYLLEVIESVPHTRNGVHYAKIVKEKYERRQTRLFFEEQFRDLQDKDLPLDVLHSRMARHLDLATATNGHGDHEFCATPITDLVADSPGRWVWDGFVARGAMTLLTGLWKVGKTTLLCHVLRESKGGDLAGREISPVNVLLVSEEAKDRWIERRRNFGLGRHIDVVSRPFRGLPTWDKWSRFVAWVRRKVEREEIGLVIFDVLANLWPVVKENDAGEVLRAAVPLQSIAEAGAGVLLINHPNKSDGSEGRASRGSGALPGLADVLVEFRRYDASRRDDTRGVLVTYSRYDESPPELVIRLDTQTNRYVPEGTRSDATAHDRKRYMLKEILGKSAPGATADRIWEKWAEDGEIPRPGKRTVETDLAALVDSNQAIRIGEGKKGSAYRYYASPDSIRASSGYVHPAPARNESDR